MSTVTVLLPVYRGDDPNWFERTITSVERQSRPADEVVVVADGPLTGALDAVLNRAAERLGSRLIVVRSPVNQGLSRTLTLGVGHCSGDYIARIDADDLMAPERLAKQLALLEGSGMDDGVDVVGSYLVEFDEVDEHLLGVRRYPVGVDQVRRAASLVNPMAHPASTWRTSTLRPLCPYREVPGAEDYDLVVRALSAGARIANIPEPLTFYRSGMGMYRRRGGLTMMRGELMLQRLLLDAGFVSRLRAARNLVVRGVFRLLPWWLKKPYYERTLAPPPASAALPA